MKIVLPSIIIRQCSVFLIILLNIFLLGRITINNRFFIDKDSYQVFPVFREKDSDTFSLGKNGDKINIPFYNRIGYVSYIKLIDSLNFTKIDNARVIIYLNFLYISLTSILIFFILFQITARKFLSLSGAILYNFTSSIIFVGSMVLNDTLAIFLLIWSVYLILKTKKVGWQSIILFTLISTLRIEYLLISLPIFLILDPEYKKRLFLLPIFSLVINLILLFPSFDKAYLNRIIEILDNIKFDGIYFIVLALLTIVLIRFLHKKVVFILAGLAALILFSLVLKEGIDLFVTTFLSFILPLSTIFLAGLSKYSKRLSTRKFDKAYSTFFLCSSFMFFIFYKTFYFHHLVVLAPFLAILAVLYLHRIDTRKLSIIKNIDTHKSYVPGILILSAVFNIFIYKAIFFKYNRDVPQIVFRELRSRISEQDLNNNSSTVIVSNFPEASYYWTKTSSLDTKSVSSNFNASKNMIYIDFTSQKPLFENYELKSEWNIPLRLNYDYYQEGIGFNPKGFRVYYFSMVSDFN